ncbi:MAG: WD40 repeat domain-containing protein [Anaerolineae bacterium]|nr:WD40 repeat domain-containing protein [Anaerolineae bacterium]
MSKCLRLLGLLVLLALPSAWVAAQGAPDQINAALEQLSQRVGRTLTLDDLDWRWAQEDFGDASLGCPQEGQSYAQVVTPGYIFTFELEGIRYEYHVSADRSIVRLCSESEISDVLDPTPTVDPNYVDPFTLCPNPEEGVVYQPTRMTIDIQAQVATGTPLRDLHEQPGLASISVAQIPPSAVFHIDNGPQCANGLLWWQVNYDGTIGWVAEGEAGAYWIEPVPGRALPADLVPISVVNTTTISEISRVEANVIAELAASPLENSVAVLGGVGTDGLWYFDLNQSAELRPTLYRTAPDTPTQLISADFSPANAAQILLGDVQGDIRVWDLSRANGLLEVTFLQGHQAETSAVAYNPDGSLIASVGTVANTLADIDRNNAILVWSVAEVQQVQALGGHTARVNALDFSPDGTLLASGSGTINAEDNSVRLWNTATGEPVAVLEGHSAPVRAVAFSPDGTLLVSASLDGMIILWDIASRAQIDTLQAGGASIVTLAFSPDGTLLASAGGDPASASPDFSIRLWDVAGRTAVAQLPAAGSTVGSVAFSADGRVLISVDDAHTVHFWGTTEP